LEKLIRTAPDIHMAHFFLALCRTGQGRKAEAVASCRRALEISDDQGVLAMAAWVLGLAGYPDEARLQIVRLEAKATSEWLDPLLVGWAYMGVEDTEAVLYWLARSVEEFSPQAIFMNSGIPFDPYRDDPRFQELLETINAPQGAPLPEIR
jgi:hypothetical protein